MLFPRPAVFISFILVILFSLRFLPVWQQTKGLCKIKCKQLLGPHKLWKCNLQRCNACLGVGVGVSNRKLITEQGPFLLFVRSLSTHTYIPYILDTYAKFMYFFFCVAHFIIIISMQIFFAFAFGMLCHLIYAPSRAAFLFHIYFIYLFTNNNKNRLNSEAQRACVCGGKQQQQKQ